MFDQRRFLGENTYVYGLICCSYMARVEVYLAAKSLRLDKAFADNDSFALAVVFKDRC